MLLAEEHKLRSTFFLIHASKSYTFGHSQPLTQSLPRLGCHQLPTFGYMFLKTISDLLAVVAPSSDHISQAVGSWPLMIFEKNYAMMELSAVCFLVMNVYQEGMYQVAIIRRLNSPLYNVEWAIKSKTR